VNRGGLLSWCLVNLLAEPNGYLAFELVRRVAPERLLVSTN
jgi:hypothetical protein